jgi:5'-nucleotidase
MRTSRVTACLLAATALLAAAVWVANAPVTAAPAGGKPPLLRILVTNDDGVRAPGIDALVESLRDLRRVRVTVSAPAANQSGTGESTTPGELAATVTATASGYEAVAVEGFPADSVLYGLDQVVAKRPHLVISGVNQGQNLGPLTEISGTVGAARTAATNGIPALAVSQGFGEPPDYDAGVSEAIEWVNDHRKALAARKRGLVEVANLNVPTCTAGDVRGLVEVPLAATPDNAVAPSDCTSTLEDPADDVEAFVNGFATLTVLPAQ